MRVAVVQYTITTRVDGDELEVLCSYCSEVGFVKIPRLQTQHNQTSTNDSECSSMNVFNEPKRAHVTPLFISSLMGYHLQLVSSSRH